MIQEILVGIIFVIALLYLARLGYQQFKQKDACAGGCSCSGFNTQELEQKMKDDQRLKS
jgi:hypothetical protein